MKTHRMFGLGLLAAVLAAPMASPPVWAQLHQVRQTVAQTWQGQPQMQLALSIAKQVVTTGEAGQPEITWQPLSGQVRVQPGEALRYEVSGENTSDRPMQSLTVTQPIPAQMTYVLDSATAPAAIVTYSIDGGSRFVANPTIEVAQPDGTVETRPAPPEAYTHVRWQFENPVQPGAAIAAAYQARVR